MSFAKIYDQEAEQASEYLSQTISFPFLGQNLSKIGKKKGRINGV